VSVILALDPGYLRNRIGISREGCRKVHEVAVEEDPFAAGEAFAGCEPSLVVLPGGPPADLYPWHPRNSAAARAVGYCEAKGVPLAVVGAGSRPESSFPRKALLSGFPGYVRKATFYEIPEFDAFAAAALSVGVPPEDARIIVVYLGDEVSVSARVGAALVDSSDPAGSEGPFGFTSSGTLPATTFVSYVSASGLDREDLRRLLKSGSGAFAHAGVDSPEALYRACQSGDPGAVKALDAMAYQVAKEVGRQMAALHGKPDCITLCGIGARISPLVDSIEKRVGKWGKVLCQLGDLTMSRLFEEGTKLLSQK